MIDHIAALIFDGEKNLLVLRKKTTDDRKECILPGGKRKENETDEQTLKRELREELSVEVEDMNFYKIDFFEGVYNLDYKYYENEGLLDYCKENDILFTVYQPLRRNKIAQKNYAFLKELAEKYSKTQNQIMINWNDESGVTIDQLANQNEDGE